MITIKHKQGASIVWDCEYLDDVGAPVADLDTYTITCEAKDSKGVVLFSLATGGSGITVYDVPNAKYRIELQDTTAFPVNKYQMDIKYALSGVVDYTETAILDVTKKITT